MMNHHHPNYYLPKAWSIFKNTYYYQEKKIHLLLTNRYLHEYCYLIFYCLACIIFYFFSCNILSLFIIKIKMCLLYFFKKTSYLNLKILKISTYLVFFYQFLLKIKIISIIIDLN